MSGLLCQLLTLLSCACTDPVERLPTTLSVKIDADEVVRAETVRVEMEIETQEVAGGPWASQARGTFRADPTDIEWPLEYSRPAANARTVRTYSVIATAHDSRGAIVGSVQAIRPVSQALRSGIELHFEAACFRRSEVCSYGQTCSRGVCVSAREELPPPAADAGAGQAGSGAGSDAGPTTATEGTVCSEAGLRACAAGVSDSPLVCDEGSWRAEPKCAPLELCDTSAGPQQGQCRPVARECMNRQPGVPFCVGDDMLVCSDLLSTTTRPCPRNEHCVGMGADVQCGCLLGYVREQRAQGECREATECGSNAGGCDPLTQCSVASGTRECSACPSGYSGTGLEGCLPLLAALASETGEVTPAVSEDNRAYRMHVPLVVHRAAVAARGPDGARVAFNASEVEPGQPWQSPILSLGETPVDLVLTSSSGLSSSYELTLERSGRQSYLKASNAQSGDWFGMSLAVAGDTLVAGAFYEDGRKDDPANNGVSDSGAAYVFERAEGEWTQRAYLKPDDGAAEDYFGASASLERDTLVIGAPHFDVLAIAPSSSARSGAAYVFTRRDGAWIQAARLTASNAAPADLFGTAVALEGDTLLVGAPFAGESGSSRRDGAVYVFTRDGDTFRERQILVPSKRINNGRFGASLAIDGDRILVGAPTENRGSVSGAGAAYLFVRQAGQWVEQEHLQPDSLGTEASFGYSVAVRGDRLAVGAPRPVTFPFSEGPGAVYVFDQSIGQSRQTAMFRAPYPGDADFFGADVQLGDGILAVGSNGEASRARGVRATAEQNHDGSLVGAAYLYALVSDAWQLTTYIKADNAASDDAFGYRVAIDGSTLAVAATLETTSAAGNKGNAPESGAVYVFE